MGALTKKGRVREEGRAPRCTLNVAVRPLDVRSVMENVSQAAGKSAGVPGEDVTKEGRHGRGWSLGSVPSRRTPDGALC